MTYKPICSWQGFRCHSYLMCAIKAYKKTMNRWMCNVHDTGFSRSKFFLANRQTTCNYILQFNYNVVPVLLFPPIFIFFWRRFNCYLCLWKRLARRFLLANTWLTRISSTFANNDANAMTFSMFQWFPAHNINIILVVN